MFIHILLIVLFLLKVCSDIFLFHIIYIACFNATVSIWTLKIDMLHDLSRFVRCMSLLPLSKTTSSSSVHSSEIRMRRWWFKSNKNCFRHQYSRMKMSELSFICFPVLVHSSSNDHILLHWFLHFFYIISREKF